MGFKRVTWFGITRFVQLSPKKKNNERPARSMRPMFYIYKPQLSDINNIFQYELLLDILCTQNMVRMYFV